MRYERSDVGCVRVDSDEALPTGTYATKCRTWSLKRALRWLALQVGLARRGCEYVPMPHWKTE